MMDVDGRKMVFIHYNSQRIGTEERARRFRIRFFSRWARKRAGRGLPKTQGEQWRKEGLGAQRKGVEKIHGGEVRER